MNEAFNVGNISHPTLSRSLIDKRDGRMRSVLKRQAEFICRGVINEDYVARAMNRMNGGFLYQSVEDSNVGFCIWKTVTEVSKAKGGTDTRHMELLLICAKDPELHLGPLMLNDIELYCSSHGISSITLQPLNEKLREWYRKFGYSDARTTKMEKAVSSFLWSFLIPKERNKTRKQKKQMRPSAATEALVTPTST
jgi:hypothetical protein